ncbi:MAG: outer membrane beta-barrel protein [Paludibacter sp.]
MKRKLSTLLVTVTLFVCANHLLAQNLYVSISGGGAFSTSTQNVPNFSNNTSTNFTSSQEQIHLSLGQGSNYGGSVGYMFNKNIGAELGLSFLIGANTYSQGSAVGGTSSSNYSANMTRFTPTIVIASGMDNINPYAKFGIIFGSGDVYYSGKETKGTDVFLYDVKMNGGDAVGISSCIGAQYKLNKQAVLYAEITTVNLSYAPTKGIFTTATYNGADVLPSMTTKNKEINFVESVKTTSSSTATPDSQPTSSLIIKYPFGSVGINLGLKYIL